MHIYESAVNISQALHAARPRGWKNMQNTNKKRQGAFKNIIIQI